MIIGYEFLTEFPNGSIRWVELRGNGGRVGDGALYCHETDRVKDLLLGRVRHELDRNGYLLEHINTPWGPYSFESRRIEPLRIMTARPIESERG